MSERWRVGRNVPINVYEGNRPICQCHTALDAQDIVDAMNRGTEMSDEHIAVTELKDIAKALNSTNALRGRRIVELADRLQRKINTLESNLCDINALYMRALTMQDAERGGKGSS